MPKLTWDAVGERIYETGTDRGVLFPMTDGTYGAGVAWSGLISVSESPSGAEPTPLYADNIKYITLVSREEFGYSIEAYTYPDEFAECDGSAVLVDGVWIGQQTRRPFGFSYRTLIGNDTDMEDHGYKLHLVYHSLASPSEKSYQTTNNDAPEVVTMSWDITTTPVPVTGKKPTAIITIDSTKVDAVKLAAFEDILYGSEALPSKLPSPDEVMTHFAEEAAGG